MLSGRPRRSGNGSKQLRRLRMEARSRKDQTEHPRRPILVLAQFSCLPSAINLRNIQHHRRVQCLSSLYPTTAPLTFTPTINHIHLTAKHTRASTANVRSFSGETRWHTLGVSRLTDEQRTVDSLLATEHCILSGLR